MSREQEILEAYEAWDPDEDTVADLVEGIGISRQRLYQVLDRHDVVPKSKRGKPRHRATDGLSPDILSEMAEMALGYVLNQLHEARSELAEYRERFGPLE